MRRAAARRPCLPARALLLLLALLLAGCDLLDQQKPGHLAVRSAQLGAAGTQLLLALDCRLSGPMQDALDHGIPLVIGVDLRASRPLRAQARATARVELRYFPLTRRYLLRVAGDDDVRAFATQAHLLAALGSLRLHVPPAFAELPPGMPLRLSAALDPLALPGALRLPALFEPAWRLSATETTWTVAAR